MIVAVAAHLALQGTFASVRFRVNRNLLGAVGVNNGHVLVRSATGTSGAPLNGKLRRIQLNKEAIAALRKLRDLAGTSEFVCPHAYGREHRTWWKAALKESKVRDFHWHDIRHTFASRLVIGVVDIYTVKELMGHAVISVTQRYAHISRPAVCRPSWILLPFHQV